MSFIADAFSSPAPAKTDPLPTRDTAADAEQAAEDERKRKMKGVGAGTALLSGSGGVASGTELTGTRSAGGG